jgi:hypothetical protein
MVRKEGPRRKVKIITTLVSCPCGKKKRDGENR